MRLGSHLGISTSRLAAFRERYHGNVPLCSMEVLLLWKHNCSEVINPRSHLALALSTIGREDLYGKIKRRTYINEAESKTSQNGNRGNYPRRRTVVISLDDDDDKETTLNTERSLAGAESGVETVESLSDSLEGESDSDDETGWDGHRVLHVPIVISKDYETRPARSTKPKSITVPIVMTSPPSSPPSSSIPSGPRISSIEDALDPDPGTVATRLEPVEPGETVAVAILKSMDGTIAIPNKPIAITRELPLDTITNSPERTEDTLEPDPDEHKDSSALVVAKEADHPKPLRNLTPKSGVTKTNAELSEDELRVLSTEIRSASEWRKLGKQLGLNQTDIKNLSKANGEGVTQCAFGVLKLWKKRFGNSAKERRILAAVISDLGRDDLYSAIIKNKLTGRIQSLEDSVKRWSDVLKVRYGGADFDTVESQHYMDIPVVYQDEDGNKTTLLSRHDILNAQKGKKQLPLILLHGDAGCGKTTFLKRLARDWAEGNDLSHLSKVPLVLFLTLEELRRCRSIGEAVVRSLLFKDSSATAGMVDEYLRMYPENSVLLVDGFDVSRSQGDLQATQTLRDQVKCQMIVTSRACLPESEDSIRKLISVEMQGIGFDQRSKFIGSFFGPDVVQGEELLQSIAGDDVLLSFCSRPMFLAIICQLWKNHAQLQDINTSSDIITSSLVLRFIGHEDVKDVVEGVSNVMSTLSRVALESIMTPGVHLTFKTMDLTDDDERECAELAERVGLIRCSPSTANDSTTHKEDREWSFIHPLVHEKCAAIGLASLHRSDPKGFEDIISAIGSIAECESMRYILTFASGESVEVAKRILRLLGDLAWKDPGSTLTAQELVLKCNFECHRNDALNRELQFSIRSLQIAAFINSFMVDVSFRYFILNSVREAENPVQIQKVKFIISSRIDMDYATACLQNGYFTSVPEFIFDMPKTFSPSREASRRLSDDVITPSLRCLMVSSIFSTRDFISNLHSSESLEELRGSDIDPKYIDLPAWCRNYPNLKTLSLSCIMYQDPRNMDDHRNSLKGLESVLCTLTSLEYLQLSNFFCSETLVQILIKVLQTLPKLSHIQAGPSGDQLHHYSEEVEETCGEVSEATIQSFTKATNKKSSSLKILQLSCFGNFEKLYQVLRSETSSRGRRGSELHYTSPSDEDGYWVFKR
ncbi:uncharacterized protein LOC105441599 [Strongylocentrotus purpuratus]|uniref:NACHT domain-containing protein n=1 Tax=Strongylocentrotus purpuratus TaxID=7668 RepID=A0A7M7PEZ4_STRPU|nr:uncharacterized protein LOC105441599 [Strongylocentrotus purpuratus]